jgi:hypothetical protein
MLITICSFIFFFGMGLRLVNRIHEENMKSKCLVHKWDYYNNQMVCAICKKTPEEVRR